MRSCGVKRQWLSDQEYLEGSALANIVPGPSLLNFTIFVSHRLGGWPAVAPGIALILAPRTVAMVGLTVWYGSGLRHLPLVAGGLRGLAAAAAALVVLTPIRLLRSQPQTPMNLGTAAIALIGVALLRLPMIEVVLPLAIIAVWLNRPGQAKPA